LGYGGREVPQVKSDHEKLDHEKLDHEKLDHEKLDHEKLDHEKLDHEKLDHEKLQLAGRTVIDFHNLESRSQLRDCSAAID